MGDRFARLGWATTFGSLAIVVMLAATAASTHAGEPPDAAGAILCRQAKPVRPKGAAASAAGADTRTHPVVEVQDRFTAEGPAPLQVRRTRALCLPAIEGEATVTLADSGFAAIDLRPPRGSERPDGGADQLLRGAFGELTVEVNGLARLLTSATLAAGSAGTNGFQPGPQDFSCYRVQADKADNLGTQSFTTADGRWTLRIQKPRRLCIPANGETTDGSGASDYVCYKAKAKRGADAPSRGDLVSSTTTFGQEILRVGHASELCFPTERTTIPPDDDVELAITPPAPGIEWRETADFQATATLADGSTEDWTDRVTWTSSDEDVAPLVDDEPGVSGRFRGIDPGTVTIRATDVTTGATATASLTVRWSLERVVIEPAQVNRSVGQKEIYQATGHFPNGVTHNVTPRLVYTSSDPAVAAAPNAAANPSRVEAMGFGTATITACDPITDICTGPDDDAEMIVLGGLQFIRIEPGTRQAVLPGQGANFTAIGHFADGRERNLTQKVTWTSSEPDVLSAPNAAPNRGRMLGVSPGGAFLRATDPKTGVQSLPHEVFVLGDLQRIDVAPFQSRAVRPPGSRHFKAIGFYQGGGSLNLTQQVEWTSETPSVGIAPNDPGDRSRIDTGGDGGLSLIRAREPVSGMFGSDAYFASLGDLQSIVISNHLFGRFFPYNRLVVGETHPVRAYGFFEFGFSVNLLNFSPDTTQLVSSDPTVAEVVDGVKVRAVAPGTFTLRATDLVSGITSDEAEFVVQGDVVRMELHGVTRARVGDTIGFEVRGHFAPDIVTVFTGPVDYASSNPAIAQVTQTGQRKGRVQCLAPGTVTISATDPRTGVSSTDTGDDITLVILPDEPPVQVTIQPPVSRIAVGGFDNFTATAHFSSGQTMNVTQQAAWSSSTPAVAEVAPTPEHGDSHTVGVAPGMTFITAVYDGVSSADSGHNAVVFVDDAVDIDIYPTLTTMGLGETRTMQATAELAGGGVINVTNQVEFLSLNVAVADFLDPANPNVLSALTVGDVTLDVGFPGGARGTATISVSETTTTTSTSTSTTTTIPGGGFTLAIEPASQSVDFGEDATFSATLTGTDGSTQDVTNRVRWKVADKSIASGNGGTLATHDPGSTTVTAVDPTTGATAAAATLNVRWALDGITLYPRQVNRGIGDYERFEAIGHFPKGRDLPITERLVFTSSAPAVAAVEPNASWPSQVVAKAEGETTITACDPLSGICSNAGGGDAALLVAGGLQSIELQPGGTAKQFPGGYEQYTAIGHYDDGSSADITASVEWISSAPGVALASNLDGTRGRVYALTAGLSFIRARDPETEIESFSAAFYTIGPIQWLYISQIDPFHVGDSVLGSATAVHQGGAERNVSQVVTWSSRDPAIAVTPNDPAAKSRIDGVGVGTARIFATDPGSGITTDDNPVLVYGDLVALDLFWQGGGWPPNRVGIGGTRTYTARGLFDGGFSQIFTNGPRPFHLVSSDPAVAEVVDDITVVGVGAGTTRITAVDDATGVTGEGVDLTVQGNMQRIVLEPATKLRGIHEYQTFIATGHFPPDDTTANVTQSLVYESSNPSVAVVFNDPAINKSTIFTVGPGTAVISATDPVSGVSSSDTGDDAIVEVIDGVPDQIVISPPFALRMPGGTEEFTAVAHYPDGTTINVTQQVEWSSTSSVAGAFLPNRKSLFRADKPGVATIIATHPSGVSSSASGHDAVMEVDAVQSLAIHPSTRRLEVGESEEFTVIATMARSGERNVTQQAFYGASPVFPFRLEIGANPNRRSLVKALAPGNVDLVAIVGGRQVKAHISIPTPGSPSGAFLSD